MERRRYGAAKDAGKRGGGLGASEGQKSDWNQVEQKHIKTRVQMNQENPATSGVRDAFVRITYVI